MRENPYHIAPKNSKHLTYEKKLELIKWFSEFYKVKVKIVKLKDNMLGGVSTTHRIINLDKGHPAILNGFFHELGHLYCINKGLWRCYHHMKSEKDLTKSELLCAIRTAMKAELWVERWGNTEFHAWFPKMKLYVVYDLPDGRDWLKKEVIGLYKKYLIKKK